MIQVNTFLLPREEERKEEFYLELRKTFFINFLENWKEVFIMNSVEERRGQHFKALFWKNVFVGPIFQCFV